MSDTSNLDYQVFMSPALDKLLDTIQKEHRDFREHTSKQLDAIQKQLDGMSKIMDMLTKSQTRLTEEYQKISDDNHKLLEENRTFLKALEDIQSTENNQLKPLLEKLSTNNERLLENIQSPVFQTRVLNRLWRSTNQLTVMNPMSMMGLTNILLAMNQEKDKDIIPSKDLRHKVNMI